MKNTNTYSSTTNGDSLVDSLGLTEITTPSGMIDSYRSDDGWSLVPEDFEDHSYGLAIRLDGHDARFNLRTSSLTEACSDARKLVEKLNNGWRPVNW